MIAAVPQLLLDAGIAAGAITAVIVLLAKVPATRWVWDRVVVTAVKAAWKAVVSGPVTSWAGRVAEQANAPLREQVTDLSDRFDAHAAYTKHHLGPNGKTPPIYTRLIAVEEAVAPRDTDT